MACAPPPPARGRQAGASGCQTGRASSCCCERFLPSSGFLGSQLDPLPPTPALLCASSSDSLQGAIREGDPPASPGDGRPGHRGSCIQVASGPGSGLSFQRATKWKMVPMVSQRHLHKVFWSTLLPHGPLQMATGEFSEVAVPRTILSPMKCPP